MEYMKGLEAYQGRLQTAVTLGKFDGLHRGHRKLIELIKIHARENQVSSVVVSFDMAYLSRRLGVPVQKLMTNAERRHLLNDEVDYLIECPFTEEICEMQAEDFIRNILVDQLHARYIVVGEGFRFGYGRKGNTDLLKALQERYDYTVEVVPKEKFEGRTVSSTYIKEVLLAGDLERVNTLLSYPFTIVGEVVSGKQIGRKLGFPTMNVHPPEEKLLPQNGVYVCQVKLADEWYEGICNIGYKPTVSSQQEICIESHLFDYNQNAYGQEIEVRLLRQERSEQRFESLEKLKEQMQQDVITGKSYFTNQK